MTLLSSTVLTFFSPILTFFKRLYLSLAEPEAYADFLFGVYGVAFPILAFCATLLIVRRCHKKKPRNEQRLTQHLTWCLATLISALFWFFPVFRYFDTTEIAFFGVGKALLASIQALIRIFAVDDFRELLEKLVDEEVALHGFTHYTYAAVGIILHLLAPILTFGFILSIFKNMHAYYKYYMFGGRNVHIFSELNEKSLALANSIAEKKEKRFSKKNLIIFADIIDKNEEEHMDLVEEAKAIGAVLFRQDISAIRFKRRKRKRSMTFYLISDDESEKISHMENVISRYRNTPNTKLYVFSDEEESKAFLDSYPNEEKENMLLNIVRVNDTRSLIYHNLDQNGLRLFERSLPCGEERLIHAVIVGFGKYGKEMIRALLWYAQLPGYRLKLTVFDEKQSGTNQDGTPKSYAQEVFKGMCPDIQTGIPHNDDGDMRYEIHFHACKEGTHEFYRELERLSDVTYVFVALGKDNLNISAAMGIRNFLAKHKRFPDVETVIYNTNLKERLGTDWDKDFSDALENIRDLTDRMRKELQKSENGSDEKSAFTLFAEAELDEIQTYAHSVKILFKTKRHLSKETQKAFADGKNHAKKLNDLCKATQKTVKDISKLFEDAQKEILSAKDSEFDFERFARKTPRLLEHIEEIPENAEKQRQNAPRFIHWNQDEISAQTDKLYNILKTVSEKISPATDKKVLRQWAKEIQTEANALLKLLSLEKDFADTLSRLSTLSGELKKHFERPYEEIHHIHVIGDLDSFYSDKTVIDSELIEDGESIHCRYCQATSNEDRERAKKTFYMDDYNFFSSVAKALHARLRKKILDGLHAEIGENTVENPNDLPMDAYFTCRLFPEFVPEPEAKSLKERPRFCNYFILKNTSDTEKATYFCEEFQNFQKQLQKEEKTDGNLPKKSLSNDDLNQLFPFKEPEAVLEAHHIQNESWRFDGEEFTYLDLMELAKSTARIEHVRWNAYMRSEGYAYIPCGDFVKDWDRPLKLHRDLRDCEELSFPDIVKDI